jgi:type I restriction enzyme, S subunit
MLPISCGEFNCIQRAISMSSNKQWTSFLISEIAEVQSGAGFPTSFQGKLSGDFPFYKVSDMNKKGNEKFMNFHNNAIMENVRRNLRAKAIPVGSVIFPKIGAAISTNKKRIISVPSCVDNNVMAIVPNLHFISSEFLYYLLLNKNISDFASDSNPPSIRKSDVEDWSINIPNIEEQHRIVEILNHAASIQRLRDEAQAKVREIVPALFDDMFGDPATNPKGWPTLSVGQVAEVQGGLQVTTARQALPIEMPYLRVANVHRNRLDLSEVKLIRLTNTEATRVKLKLGDLLIVEGHGNASEIGRVAIWNDSIPNCVHQNHLIRARCDQHILIPEFLSAYLNSTSGRQFLLRQGKTTSGLSTISVSNVKAVRSFVPPLALQQQFADRVAEIESTVALADKATRAADQLTQSLLSQVFSPIPTQTSNAA